MLSTLQDALRDRLSWGKLDILVTVDIDSDNLAGVDIHPIGTSPNVLLIGRDHPLAGRDGLTLADFAEDVFFIPGEEDSPGRKASLCKITRRYGFAPGSIRTVPNIESAFVSVAAGLGVTIVDKSAK